MTQKFLKLTSACLILGFALQGTALAADECEEVKTTEYEGTVCNGEFHGQGLQYKTDGSKHYRGRFVAGKYEGKGTLFLSDGRLEASFKNGKIEGPGKIILDDGHVFFDGSYKKSYKSGFGTLTYVDGGGTYVGEFKHDQFHGQGELHVTRKDGSKVHYVGGFKHGKFDGQGELKATIHRYSGGFKDGHFHGQGVRTVKPLSKEDLIEKYGEEYHSLNLDLTGVRIVRYEGEFLRGNSNGLGTAQYSNGDSYTGLFKASQPTENGKHLDKNGKPSSRHLIAKKVSLPKVPSKAEKSGRCLVHFDINALGETENAKIKSCTDDVFAKAAMKYVKKTEYYPKMENGVAVPRKNWGKSIRFSLTDEYGRYIPE